MKQSILALSLFLVAFNSFALPINWYHTVPPIDIPVHISFGVLIGLFVITLWKKAGGAHPFVIIILGVLIVGTMWEIVEFLRDTYFALPRGIPPAQLSYADTLSDMMYNLVGGTLAYILVFNPFAKQNRKKSTSLRTAK
ncbi:MAG: hypothetical protein HY471_00245 [Candidatus Sungbacteria bacterium]|nr:hypothetical protein [Candidatus Sungbacteria bacterium]